MTGHTFLPNVAKWGVQEIICPGRSDGNPFQDYEIRGIFTSPQEPKEVAGFYDGNGQYVVRFMPSFEGHYTYQISGSFSHETFAGSFDVLPAEPHIHGPVQVADTFHFAYADGTRYMPVGTTCYVWHLQTEAIFENTLRTLAASPFNKIRFCVFPKHYDYNHNEPASYPFEPAAPSSEGRWDFTRYCPEYFRHLEKAVIRLGEIGIEADIIILHPYDRWGFSQMTREEDIRYFRYLACRLGVFRNVWWSLANEYDILAHKSAEDWEAYGLTLKACDPYQHLISIHNCIPFYDHTRPWITHCCIQRQQLHLTTELTDTWRKQFGKPVIVDEMGYEGDIQHGWGNLTGEEITRRFWEATVRGGYGGHGETYLNEQEILWWSHGDVLHGQSPARLAFLRDFLESLPAPMMRLDGSWDEMVATQEGWQGDAAPFYLYYYSFMRPSFRDFQLPEGATYRITVLDTWNMTKEDRGIHTGHVRVALPARCYMAVYLEKVDAHQQEE